MPRPFPPSSPPRSCSPRPRPPPPPQPADRVLRNGAIHTIDARDRCARRSRPRRRDRLRRLGRGVRRFIGRRTKVTDLRGRMVMPGLHDGHIHGITEAADACSLDYEPLTVAAFTGAPPGLPRRDAGRGARRLAAGLLVVPAVRAPRGDGRDAGGARRAADAAAVVVSSSDGHTSLVNSRGLALAGITAATPDPADGRIEHARTAQPNGLLQDGAQRLVSALLPPPTGRPGRRGAPRHAALRARGHHVVLRARLRRRRRDRGVRAAAQGRRADRPRALRDRRRSRRGADTVASLSRTGDRLRERFETRAAAQRARVAARPRSAARGSSPEPGISIDGIKLVPRRRRAGAGADRRAARALPRRRAAGSRAAASSTSTTRSSAGC